jgi:hypothetical protein
MTGDGFQEMEHGRRMTINLLPVCENIAVMRSYTIVEITYFDFKLRSYTGTQICRHMMYRRHSSPEYETDHDSEHYSEIPNYGPTCPSRNAEYDPDSSSVIPSHTATSHHGALRDLSLAEQRSLKRGMMVPESQQRLPQRITIPEVQERSTVKRIHRWRRLAVASAHGEEATIVFRERRKVHPEK